MTASNSTKPSCKNLVLDAGPLLSLSPLRGLAENYYTVPQVLSELKDRNAREHFEKLGLSAGVRIQVQTPDSTSLAHVIQFSKKTGDYSVLAHADLCVLALTYGLDKKEKDLVPEVTAEASNPEASSSESVPEEDSRLDIQGDKANPVIVEEEVTTRSDSLEELPESSQTPPTHHENTEDDDQPREKLDVEISRIKDEDETPAPVASSVPQPTTPAESDAPLFEDPSDDDDGEGEWITPSNVSLHKSRALHLLPNDDNRKGSQKPAVQIPTACMTADFAMQNVILQMGLSLVGVEGKKIDRVKTWVLRCHACFKICKDASRKFCPSCGNPTLLRASVTLSSPNATSSTPTLQVHLKKNFQYKTRGTIFSIPAPKPGTSKTGSGEGLVLREDQTTWMRAKKLADGKREREEKRILKGAISSKGDGGTVVSSWMDPDWVPEMLSVGSGGKGRTIRGRGMDGDMPVIGHGKKNPNERRKKK